MRRLEGNVISSWEIETSAVRRLRKSGNSGRASTLSVITGKIVTTGRTVSVLEREAMKARQRLSHTLSARRWRRQRATRSSMVRHVPSSVDRKVAERSRMMYITSKTGSANIEGNCVVELMRCSVTLVRCED